MRNACILASLLWVACGDDGDPAVDMAVAIDAGPPPPPSEIGPEERPASVRLPGEYDSSGNYPIVMVLHGNGASGLIQGAYFGIPRLARDMEFIAILPDGTLSDDGTPYWNATDVYIGRAVDPADDVAYLTGLIDEALATYAADPERVYLLGHSNGGFMAYRLACDASETFAGLVSLAGSTWNDPADCGDPAEPVSVLQIHGTMDDTIRYEGGDFRDGAHPSARETVERFADRSGCDDTWTDGEPVDFVTMVDGAETLVESRSTGCTEGTDYQLWTIVDGTHIPTLSDGATQRALEWLLAR